ncbi:MAG: acylphosphatase [Chitinophagaceae bacterium]
MEQTLSILVYGKVQGVFFRQTAKEKADQAGIHGEVRNTGDEKVAILATGTPEQLSAFVEWCRQGPPKAKVTGVDVKEIPLQLFFGFKIIRY